MTGTVTGVPGYPWYTGGQWRVMSPNCSTIWSPRPVRTRGGVDRVQIVWPISASSPGSTHEPRTAVPIRSHGTTDSSRSRLSSKRSRR